MEGMEGMELVVYNEEQAQINQLMHDHAMDSNRHVLRPQYTMIDGRKVIDPEPPWHRPLAGLNFLESQKIKAYSPQVFQHTLPNWKYDLERTNWLYDKRHGKYRLLDRDKPLLDQINPVRKEYVVGITPHGAYTKVMKGGREMAYIGPDEKRYANFQTKIVENWKRQTLGRKICIVVALFIATCAVIGIVILLLRRWCEVGYISGQTCVNVGMGPGTEETEKNTPSNEPSPTCTPPCINGGHCQLDGKNLRCNCTAGYTGFQCEEKLNEKNTTEIHSSTEAIEITDATEYTDNYGKIAPKEKPTGVRVSKSQIAAVMSAIVVIAILIAFLITKMITHRRKTALALPVSRKNILSKQTSGQHRKKSTKRRQLSKQVSGMKSA